MQDFDWAAHTGAMFWPELKAYLYHSCCSALFTSGQSETTNRGLRPWELPLAEISIDFCFPALTLLHKENKDLKEMLLQKKNPQILNRKTVDTTWLYCIDGRERTLKFLAKPIKSVFSFLNNGSDESELGNLFCTVLIGCETIFLIRPSWSWWKGFQFALHYSPELDAKLPNHQKG